MTQGRFYVISAPSGAGKTSLVKALIEENRQVGVAISHTTRKQRDGESDGVNYYFVTKHEFQQMVESGEFIEWANVFGNLYGTSSDAVSEVLAGGQHIVLEIDWQGAEQIRQKLEYAETIFVFPPSHAALRERLVRRGQDDPETVENRLSNALEELSQYREFDYLIVNDDFETALAELKQIIDNRGDSLLRDERLPELKKLLTDLQLI